MDYFDDDLDSPSANVGREIYRNALEDRRGFRPDQLGIPTDDPVWLEIFEALSKASAEASD